VLVLRVRWQKIVATIGLADRRAGRTDPVHPRVLVVLVPERALFGAKCKGHSNFN
jgi:hypothetical protein